MPLNVAFIPYIQSLQWNGSSIFTIFIDVDIDEFGIMLKKLYLSIAFFYLFYPLYAQTNPDNIPTSTDSSNVEIVSENVEVLKDIELDTSIASLVDSTLIRAEKEAELIVSKANQERRSVETAILQGNKELESIETAISQANKELESAKTAILQANKDLEARKAEILKENEVLKSRKDAILKEESDLEAQKKASDIISDSADLLKEKADLEILTAQEEAKRIIAKAKKTQKFFDHNSLFILAILTLLVIVFLIRTISDLNNKGINKLDELSSEGMDKLDKLFSWREKVNKNTILLPEVFISDWNKLAKSIELLSERIGNVKDRDKDKSLAILIEKIRLALPDFAEKINTNSKIGLSEVVDSLEPLKKQLELQKESNKQLKEGYDFNTRKRFTLELISIKDLLDHCLKGNLDKGNKDIAQISEKIQRFFAKNGIYTIQHEGPEVLVDYNYKEHEKIDEAITADSSKEGKISGVKKIGYYFKDLEGKRLIIRRAKVSIYALGGKKK